MSSSADDSVGLGADVLEAASRRLEDLDDADLEPGRRSFFEGLRALDRSEPEEAARKFRRAARDADPPIAALARVSRAECERLRGRVGVALREWRSVAEDDTAPRPTRYVAWLSIAAAADDRGDQRLLERARRAIDELETSGDG